MMTRRLFLLISLCLAPLLIGAEDDPGLTAVEIADALSSGNSLVMVRAKSRFQQADEEKKAEVIDRLIESMRNEAGNFEPYSDALAVVGEPSVAPLIELFKSEEDGNVRYKAGWTLSKIKFNLQPHEEIFKKALKDPVVYVRYTAAFILGGPLQSRNKLVINTVIEAVKSRYPGFQAKGCAILGTINPPSSVMISPVIRLLSSSDPLVRSEAYGALRRWIKSPEVQEAVSKLQKSEDPELQVMSALLLARTSKKDDVPHELIVDGLRHSSPQLRLEAARILFDRCRLDREAEEALRAFLPRSMDERQAALSILRKCSPDSDSMIDSLIETMNLTDNQGEQCSAALELGEMGRKARRAMPAVEKLLENYPDRLCLQRAAKQLKGKKK